MAKLHKFRCIYQRFAQPSVCNRPGCSCQRFSTARNNSLHLKRRIGETGILCHKLGIIPTYWCVISGLFASLFHHKLLTRGSNVVLRPKGSNNPGSCLAEVVSPWYCFPTRPTCFPGRARAASRRPLCFWHPRYRCGRSRLGFSGNLRLHLVPVPALPRCLLE